MKMGNFVKSSKQLHDEAHGYMLACTDSQLRGVIETEQARIKNHRIGDVVRVARIMLDEAQKEMAKRGLTKN